MRQAKQVASCSDFSMNWTRMAADERGELAFGCIRLRAILNWIRTYAVGVLAGVTQRVPGAACPRESSFYPPLAAKPPEVGKKKGVLWRAKPSKEPNRVTPMDILHETVCRGSQAAWYTGVAGDKSCEEEMRPKQSSWEGTLLIFALLFTVFMGVTYGAALWFRTPIPWFANL